MTVLTEKDWTAVRNALTAHKSIELDRTYEPTNTRVVVTIMPVSPPWAVEAVIKVTGYFRGGWWRQYFETVGEAKEAIKQWNGWP